MAILLLRPSRRNRRAKRDMGSRDRIRPYMPGRRDDVTTLLRAWGAGNEQALHELIPLVERELNRIARACLAGDRGNRSVSATALVNEAFLRLVQLEHIDWRDRAHFLSIGARLMRPVLVD